MIRKFCDIAFSVLKFKNVWSWLMLNRVTM